VKQPEPHRLLNDRVTFDLDVGAVPEAVEVFPLGID
jgi:hypothetical protein